MKQKKWLYIIYMLVVALLLLVPVCLIPVQGETVSREKRELAQFPQLWQEDGLNLQYSTELEAYLADHLAGRSLFATGYHWLIGEVLQSSPTDQVIVGEDDWLFYGETMADYRGTNRWSEEELQTAVQSLREMQDFVEKQGGQFLFVIAPNKNSLYPEYMPYYELASEEPSNAERLIQAMEEQGIGTVDLFRLFREEYQENGETYYHKRDSHWNTEGARLAYCAVMDALGVAYDAYEEAERTEVRNWEGDLDALIYPELGYLDLQVEYGIEYTYEYESRFRSPEDMEIVTSCEGAERALYMIRDSFGNVLYPFLAEQFGNATFSRVTPWQLPQLTEGDVVIIELVERNLDQLLDLQVQYAEIGEDSDERAEGTPIDAPEATTDGISTGKPEDMQEGTSEGGAEQMPGDGTEQPGMNDADTSDGIEQSESDATSQKTNIADKEQMSEELSAICRDILSGILTDGMTERERAYAIYKWTESHIRYSGNTPTDSWVSSALLTLDSGKGNCYGYYSVSRALLTEAGFLSTEVKFPNNGHYWNLVQMSDGCWYHFDTTTGWGGERFLLTDEELAAYRYRDLYYEWNEVELPEEPETPTEPEAPGKSGEGGSSDVGSGATTEDDAQSAGKQETGSMPEKNGVAERPSTAGLKATSVRLADGTVLSLNQNMTEVSAMLGAPDDYMESVSCMYDGMDKTWIYPSVIIKTYPNGERDYIQSIEITSEAVALASAVWVGDPLERVFDVYGESTPSASGYYEYEFDGYGLVFYLDNTEQVEAIELYLK